MISPLTKVSVIIVNWNTSRELERCLRSLENFSGLHEASVVVVDNASDDGSAAMVQSGFPRVSLVRNERNLGFAAGVNIGLSQTVTPYALILNPDIVLREEVLGKMVEVLESSLDVAACAPVLVDDSGERQAGYFRRLPSLGQISLFYTILASWSERSAWMRNRWLEFPFEGSKPVIEVDQIPGACLMVRRSVVDAVGMMDEQFFLFFEDVDWCCRMRRAGWKLKVLNDVSLRHSGGRSFRVTGNEWMVSRFLLSLNIFMDKHASFPVRILTKCVTVGNSVLILCARTLQRILKAGDIEGARSSILRQRTFLKFFRAHYGKNQLSLTRNWTEPRGPV